MGAQAPDCRSCRHFFITHQPAWPYGCRSFEIKSPRLPSIDILRSSGQPCHAHEPRGDDKSRRDSAR